MKWNRLIRTFSHILLRLFDAHIKGITLRSTGQIDRRLHKRYVAFGQSDHLYGSISGHRDLQRGGVGQTDVL